MFEIIKQLLFASILTSFNIRRIVPSACSGFKSHSFKEASGWRLCKFELKLENYRILVLYSMYMDRYLTLQHETPQQAFAMALNVQRVWYSLYESSYLTSS